MKTIRDHVTQAPSSKGYAGGDFLGDSTTKVEAIQTHLVSADVT